MLKLQLLSYEIWNLQEHPFTCERGLQNLEHGHPYSLLLRRLKCIVPHGGVRPVHQKSTHLTKLTLGPYVVQIWSRNPRNSEATWAHGTLYSLLIRRLECIVVERTADALCSTMDHDWFPALPIMTKVESGTSQCKGGTPVKLRNSGALSMDHFQLLPG